MKSKIMLFKRTFWSGLAARFELASIAWNKKLALAAATARLLQRSQGGARSAGDMSGSRCAVAVAG